MKIKLAYHREGLEIEVPDENLSAVIEDRAAAPLPDPQAAVRKALADPIGGAPLSAIATRKRPAGPRGERFRAVIAISDITRPVPNREILPPLVEALNAAGLADAEIEVLIGTGLHRPATDAEVLEMVGPELVKRIRVTSHTWQRPETLVDLGRTDFDTPVKVNRTWVEADLRIMTGLVEPHMMAGFSGGRKGICPGLAGQETVKRFHAVDMMGHVNAMPGVIEGNPVNTLSHAVAAMCPPDFLVNVTVDRQVRMTSVYAGDYIAAWREAVKFAEHGARVPVREAVDIVISTNGGYPLDLTYYQGQKGMIAALPILKPGATIIFAMACAEGLGQEEFSAMCRKFGTLDEFLRDACSHPGQVIRDQWALQYLHKVASKHEVMLYSSYLEWELQKELFVTPVRSMAEGLQRALKKHGPEARIAVMPKGAYVLPYLAEKR